MDDPDDVESRAEKKTKICVPYNSTLPLIKLALIQGSAMMLDGVMSGGYSRSS